MTTSKGHKGGDVKYDRLKFNIERLLARESNIIATTFIDFFRLKSDFPKFQEALKISNKLNRIEFLEQALEEGINHSHFVP